MLVNTPAHFNPHTSVSLRFLKCAVQVCGLAGLDRTCAAPFWLAESKITSALKREPVESKRGHCCGRSAGKEITLAPMQVLV